MSHPARSRSPRTPPRAPRAKALLWTPDRIGRGGLAFLLGLVMAWLSQLL